MKRIREVEQENTILSLLIVRMLKHLSQHHPEDTQKIVDEIAAVLQSGPPTSSDLLRQMLDLPAETRTPIHDYSKPTMVRPRPMPGASMKKS